MKAHVNIGLVKTEHNTLSNVLSNAENLNKDYILHYANITANLPIKFYLEFKPSRKISVKATIHLVPYKTIDLDNNTIYYEESIFVSDLIEHISEEEISNLLTELVPYLMRVTLLHVIPENGLDSFKMVLKGTKYINGVHTFSEKENNISKTSYKYRKKFFKLEGISVFTKTNYAVSLDDDSYYSNQLFKELLKESIHYRSKLNDCKLIENNEMLDLFYTFFVDNEVNYKFLNNLNMIDQIIIINALKNKKEYSEKTKMLITETITKFIRKNTVEIMKNMYNSKDIDYSINKILKYNLEYYNKNDDGTLITNDKLESLKIEIIDICNKILYIKDRLNNISTEKYNSLNYTLNLILFEELKEKPYIGYDSLKYFNDIYNFSMYLGEVSTETHNIDLVNYVEVLDKIINCLKEI